MLIWACVLTIVSLVLAIVWIFVYFNHYYKEKYIYVGMGDPEDYGNYRMQTK